MDNTKKLSDDELNGVDGGTLFVSIDGGEKIRAEARCVGGELSLDYKEGGVSKRYNTGIDLSGRDLIGTLKFIGLRAAESQNIVDYTYNINTKG